VHHQDRVRWRTHDLGGPDGVQSCAGDFSAAEFVLPFSMKTFTTAISGMTCNGCVKAVQKAIGSVSGATADDVTIGSATVTFDEWLTSETAISDAIRKAGFSTQTA
jgi:copper chaperone